MIKKLIYLIKQTKQEFNKVTWPDKRQSLNVTGIVFIMVAVIALYFFFLDWILSSAVDFLLNLG